MPKPIPENVQRLITEYQQSQARLIDIISKTEAKGNSTRYRKQILASVSQELNTLNKFAAKWVANEIPGAYQAGIDQAYESYRKANITVAVVAANQKVLRNLINNATGSLTDANQFVGRRITDDLRKAGIEAVAQKLSTGATVKETKAILLQKMSDKGITTIVNKRGNAINLDAYASTIARTTTREATNKGAIQAVQDVGGDLVKISQHFSSCSVCATYEGRAYSISGKSKDYPALDEAFSGGYSTIHPNCTHVALPYFPNLDDNAEQLKADSNRPFNVEPKDKASIAAYNKDQAIKSARRTDRNAWEKAKLENVPGTSKTFSGYRSQLRAAHK